MTALNILHVLHVSFSVLAEPLAYWRPAPVTSGLE